MAAFRPAVSQQPGGGHGPHQGSAHILVPQMNQRVPWVESHAVAVSEPGVDVCHVGTRRYVDISQVTRGGDSRHEPVVAQKAKPVDLWLVIAQAVQLRACRIVNVQVLVLRRREHRVVAEEADVTHGLLDVQLDLDPCRSPVHNGDVALPAAEQQVLPVRCIA